MAPHADTGIRASRRPRKVLLLVLAVAASLVVLLVAFMVRGRGAPGRDTAPLLDLDAGPLRDTIATLGTGSAVLDDAGSHLLISLPPMDVPAGGPGAVEGTIVSPLAKVRLPADGYISGFRVEVLDQEGRVLPQTFLHHVNLYDPNRRELFAPIQLHLFAASKETPAVSVPRLLFGIPVRKGQLVFVKGMLANARPDMLHGATIRLVGTFTPANRPWPLFRAYPWVMDVLFPTGRRPDGSKGFDLPPGRSTHFWVSSPAIPGTIIGMGGHVHDYVDSLEFADSTTGEFLWRGRPVESADGTVQSLPAERFTTWNRFGIHITPAHRYQVTVVYDNPTGDVIMDGGMGVVAGLFVPDRGTVWPAVDPGNPDYQTDLMDAFAGPSGPMEMAGHHHH